MLFSNFESFFRYRTAEYEGQVPIKACSLFFRRIPIIMIFNTCTALCVADVIHAGHPGMGAGHGLSSFVCC